MPRYYERDADGVPRTWVGQMRRSMASTLWRFSTTRMLHEYVEQMYLPAAAGGRRSGATRADVAKREGRPARR